MELKIKRLYPPDSSLALSSPHAFGQERATAPPSIPVPDTASRWQGLPSQEMCHLRPLSCSPPGRLCSSPFRARAFYFM